MNKVIVTFALMMVAHFASSQQVYIAPSVEKTITGVEYGSGIYYRNRAAFTCGIFYQTGIEPKAETFQRVNPFYGVGASVPLVKCDRMIFNANTRVGFVNKNFLVCVPGLETEIKLFKKISFSVGMSMRRGAVSANTSLKCFI